VRFSLQQERSGHLVCSLADDAQEATVTASNVPDAPLQLIAALDAARDNGYGECLWLEGAGEYRWMLRRERERLTLVVLWSSGTLTGWQHVFRTECALDPLREQVLAEWARVAPS
jgi:hypothetical protein